MTTHPDGDPPAAVNRGNSGGPAFQTSIGESWGSNIGHSSSGVRAAKCRIAFPIPASLGRRNVGDEFEFGSRGAASMRGLAGRSRSSRWTDDHRRFRWGLGAAGGCRW